MFQHTIPTAQLNVAVESDTSTGNTSVESDTSTSNTSAGDDAPQHPYDHSENIYQSPSDTLVDRAQNTECNSSSNSTMTDTRQASLHKAT